MNFTRRFILVIVLFIMVFSVACSTGGEVSEIGQVNDPYNYIASIENQDTSISGSEFQVRTDNCGASVSAKETLARSRSFNISLNADVATSLGGEFEGDVLVVGAKVQAAVETSLGIQIGTTETVDAERTLETPANSISIITLQWEEVWDTGNVNIFDTEGNLKGEVPFRILTTLRLSQKSVEEVPCNNDSTPNVTETTAITPVPPTNTPVPPIPATPIRIILPNTATPQPTADIYEIIVQADEQRNQTGIYIKLGDIVSIKFLEGRWRAGPLPTWPFYGPSGDPQVGSKETFPVQDKPIMGLVGGIGIQRPFWVGATLQFESSISGELWLGANDDDFSDNNGSLIVIVTISEE